MHKQKKDRDSSHDLFCIISYKLMSVTSHVNSM